MPSHSSLGVSEAGNFPAAIKTVAEWFPKKERAFATGIFNSGANIGAIAAPLTVPFIAQSMGWQWAFIITGSVGFIWVIFWFLMYEVPLRHKRLSRSEYNYIHSDADEIKIHEEQNVTGNISWIKIMTFRQTWAFV